MPFVRCVTCKETVWAPYEPVLGYLCNPCHFRLHNQQRTPVRNRRIALKDIVQTKKLLDSQLISHKSAK